ncbi:MAG: glycerol-3-phosphate 1-O-acyltransferase PlsY [Bacilli bacterium]|jgi:glycerol-3-phosphate acyltransferase PlsY|nr:glycerol-3-phosphate 1-O-acyltransferase PlsY [Bacilli bacterium]
MDIIYNIVVGIGSLIIGYLIGSFPTAIVIGRVFFKQDPRNFGSKNAGGTNAGRLWGKKAGLAVMIVDIIKAVLAIWTVYLLINFTNLKNVVSLWNNGLFYYYLGSLGAAIGHCWPIYANFRGGKAVSALAGMVVATSWFLSLFGLVFFVVLKNKKFVSLSSIIASSVVTLASWVMLIVELTTPGAFNFGMWGNGSFFLAGWEYTLVISIITIILILRHHENIKRLSKNEENKVRWIK